MIYAGIGWRETPIQILDLMQRIAVKRAACGIMLRSGHANGPDRFFEAGAAGRAEIFTKDDYDPAWELFASFYHPAWNKCNDIARRLHARNVPIIFGRRFDAPVNDVICYTKTGGPTGGTGQAIRMAERHGIPVYNLHEAATMRWFKEWCAA